MQELATNKLRILAAKGKGGKRVDVAEDLVLEGRRKLRRILVGEREADAVLAAAGE